jgi:hypothetical protein
MTAAAGEALAALGEGSVETAGGRAASAAAWGEASGEDNIDDGPGGESMPSEIDLGGGIKLKIAPDMFRQIMHSPEITSGVQQRCQEISDTANGMAITEGAVYTFQVSNNSDNIRARGRVKPGNYKAVIDDEYHDTLLKALESVGSDPYPTYSSDSPEGPEEGGPDADSEAEEPAEEEGAAAEAEVGELAEVAAVAAL